MTKSFVVELPITLRLYCEAESEEEAEAIGQDTLDAIANEPSCFAGDTWGPLEDDSIELHAKIGMLDLVPPEAGATMSIAEVEDDDVAEG